MKKILVVTTFNNHFRFFYRLSQILQNFGYEFHYLTNKWSIYKEGRSHGLEINLLESFSNSKHSIDVTKSFEVAANFLSESKAHKITSSVWRKLEKEFENHKYDYIFLWGGVRLIELTSAKFAESKNVKTLFFELGNFPGKIFVDPKGTNARSLLAENPEVLLKLDRNLDSYKKWSEGYISSSLKLHSVPQSKSASNIEYQKNVEDIVGYRFHNLIQTEPIITKEKIIGKYLRKFLKLEYDNVDLANTNYAFYPMQVNKDAQLILNSKIGNLEALQIANEKAKSSGLKLLVKPHPGEVEFGFIQKVNNLKKELGFAFVDNNTIELIISAQEVITINSTVGLQAKITGKKVTCLGKAFYQDFDEEMLAAYIQNYLIEAEFWNDTTISESSAKHIISRAELNKNK